MNRTDGSKPRYAVWGMYFVGALFAVYSCIAVAPLVALLLESDQVIWNGQITSRRGNDAIVQVNRGGRSERVVAQSTDTERRDHVDLFRHRGSGSYTAVRRVEWLAFPVGVVVAGLPIFFARSPNVALGPTRRLRRQ